MNFFAKACLLITALTLSGCGFQPLYAKKPKEDVSKIFAGVKIDSIPGRSGQELKAALEDHLNPGGAIPQKPTYRLSLTLVNSTVPIGVARDGTVSRFNIYVTSHYTLYRIADDKAVTSGDLSYVNSYNNLANEYYSTYISEQDAIKRNVTEIAQLYRQRLSTYLDAGAPEEDPNQIAAGQHPVAYTPVLFNQIPGITAAPITRPQ
jgi:LPS-assembly lipoprotein